jgi:3-methylcrotonyl-CoA carboxylase alpha subunit
VAVIHHGTTYAFQAVRRGPAAWTLSRDGATFALADAARADDSIAFVLDGEPRQLPVARDDQGLLIGFGGRGYRVEHEAPLDLDHLGGGHTRASGHMSLEAPMPGTIIKVLVSEGDTVEANQPLLVLEAMKMEHTVVAPYAGVVAAIPFGPGQLVSGGMTLIELDAVGEGTANP